MEKEKIKEFLEYLNEEFPNFLEKTNIGGSFYSARELRFMNECLIKGNELLKELNE
jgi:hypothetical protein